MNTNKNTNKNKNTNTNKIKNKEEEQKQEHEQAQAQLFPWNGAITMPAHLHQRGPLFIGLEMQKLGISDSRSLIVHN
jgi:hypothetical protein